MQSCFAKSYFRPSPREEIQCNPDILRQEDTQIFPDNTEMHFTPNAISSTNLSVESVQKYNKPEGRIKLKSFLFFFLMFKPLQFVRVKSSKLIRSKVQAFNILH